MSFSSSTPDFSSFQNALEPFSGSIELIIGPMFSGKTTELLRRIKRHSLAKRKCIVIKYKNDVRYSVDKLSTHDLSMMDAISCKKLEEAIPYISDANVIGIDEGQFYPDLLSFCETQANAGKIVIVSALDATFERKRFNDVVDLIPMCESVVKLNAVCTKCGGIASFTHRTIANKSVELIGGADLYTSLCRKCFLEMEERNKEEFKKINVAKENSPVIENPNSPILDSTTVS